MKLNNKKVEIIYIGSKQVKRITMFGSIVYEYNEPAGHELSIVGPFNATGETCQLSALYDNESFDISLASWSVTSGGDYASISSSGLVTIDSSASGNGVTIQCTYLGLSATHIMQVTYVSGGSTETTTETTVDPITGDVTTVVETVVDNGDGSSSTNTVTTVTDENGDPVGSNETTSTQNADGSSSSTSTNYDSDGNPTDQTNQVVDTSGNESTQQIEYDENGDPEVTGYEIDTSGSSEGEKAFNGDGVNTEFYGFDTTRGFVMHMHFSIDFTKQPANQDENHHNILTMKRATPEPWYGFQIRQTSTTKNVIIGTQFATGSNTNTSLPVGRQISSNEYEYDIEVTYDPTSASNKFVCRELINDVTVFTSNNSFPDIPELEYLTVCIGYALDANGDPYRYSNINVYEFSINKLTLIVPDPVIQFNGYRITISCESVAATIYYKLNHASTYSEYIGPIDIFTDTYIETYAAVGDIQSNVVDETCIYVPAHDYSQDYLTFRVLTAGNIVWTAFGTGYTRTIEYSINDGTWISITSTSAGVSIPVGVDDVVRFRGTNNTYAGSKSNYSGFEGSTANFDIEGNIMSLIYGDNFINQSTMSGTYNFCSIFKKATVVSAENLVLPATTLTNYCYRAMFSLCPVMDTPPALPATSLAQGCYWYMFEGCGITTAPELLATTLVRECYGYMFTGCSSLNYIKCLATSGFGTTQCLTGWVNRVAATGTFIKDANATSWTSGNNGIPPGWIVQTA